MAITQVYATSVTCEHPVPDGERPCPSRLLGDPDLTDDQARIAAAERGWSADPLRCPKHRGSTAPEPVAEPAPEPE